MDGCSDRWKNLAISSPTDELRQINAIIAALADWLFRQTAGPLFLSFFSLFLSEYLADTNMSIYGGPVLRQMAFPLSSPCIRETFSRPIHRLLILSIGPWISYQLQALDISSHLTSGPIYLYTLTLSTTGSESHSEGPNIHHQPIFPYSPVIKTRRKISS
jgi:hypothetical protein